MVFNTFRPFSYKKNSFFPKKTFFSAKKTFFCAGGLIFAAALIFAGGLKTTAALILAGGLNICWGKKKSSLQTLHVYGLGTLHFLADFPVALPEPYMVLSF